MIIINTILALKNRQLYFADVMAVDGDDHGPRYKYKIINTIIV